MICITFAFREKNDLMNVLEVEMESALVVSAKVTSPVKSRGQLPLRPL